MKLDYVSPFDGYSRTSLRVGFAVLCGLIFLGETHSVASMAGDSHYVLPASSLFPTNPAFAWGIFAFILGGLGAIALDKRSLPAGIWALCWMSVLSYWKRELAGTPSRNSFFPGVMLLGWVLGLAWARAVAGADADKPEGRAFRERLAEAGAMACIAAGYTSSALSKLFATGFDWINPHQVRWLILSQEPLAQWAWLTSYRNLVIESPSVGWFSALMTIVIEGGGFFLLFGPRLRLFWTAMIWALHVNIIFLCFMPYVEPMSLLLLFSVPWPRLFKQPRIEDPLATKTPDILRPTMPDKMWILLTIIIVLCWVLPIGWRAG